MSAVVLKSEMIQRLGRLAKIFENEMSSILDDTFFDRSAQQESELPISDDLDFHTLETNTLAELIGKFYEDSVNAMQETSEADAHPSAYWDLVTVRMLNYVNKAIKAQQLIMATDKQYDLQNPNQIDL